MMNKLYTPVLILLLSTSLASAQSVISGRVSNEDGEALSGANILIESLEIGTSTDFEGNYSLQVPSTHLGQILILTARFVGYRNQTREITVEGDTMTVDFVLRTDLLQLDDLVVMSRNREELLQDVPLAISAFSGRDLESRQIETTDRLGQIIPNLIYNHSGALAGTKSAAQIYIRGVGQRDYLPVTDPGVALYVDGIYMPRTVGAILDLVDLERVEVLRGPQGTLFGRNAVGGAISVHSRRPDAEAQKSIRAQFGDDRMINLTASANGALKDGLFGGIVLALRNREGYVKRVHDGLDMGNDNLLAARSTIMWHPSETLEIFATGDYSRRRENGAPTVNGGVNDKQAFATMGNVALPGCTAIRINPNFPESGPPTFPPPGNGANGAEGCYGPDSFAGEYVSEGTFPVFSDIDAWGASAQISWSIGKQITLLSLTGYRGLDMVISRDADNTPANILQNENVVKSSQLSQEIRLSGVGLNNRMHWQTGLYLADEVGFSRTSLVLPTGSFDSNWDLGYTSIAGFAQATTNLIAGLSLTAGARYTRDYKSVLPDVFALGDASQGRRSIHAPTWPLLKGIYRPITGAMNPGDRMLPNRKFTRDFDALTAMANLAYKFSDNMMAYVSFTEGFKSGGFDARVPTPPPGFEANSPDAMPTDYEPETLDSYEVGIKSNTSDGRLKLNLTLFRAEYEDVQVIIRQSINPITVNGGSADLQGIELEGAWAPVGGWTLVANLGFLDAEYDELSTDVLESNTPVLPGSRLPKTPRATHSLEIGRTLDIRNLTVVPKINWTYMASQYHDAVNTPQLFQEGYHLLNASISFATADGKWEVVSAFRNLTDERYLLTGTSAWGTAAAYIEHVYGRPFEWSISAKRLW
ncbi:MAG: TonB-dependent receptor [Rhodothermaceae bacterium]|nr:TonB-dependent receptor [Rhodothermaceae bacterium]MXZ56976.1 TonB-dependent receptor [Rhodothermaceae bacterium]MYB90711.1 TonB-dependent receptor [Rhodothermaceae bacterium]MYD68732.1 TonB-dependent receptor [Rhodothermaceae bacterium]MYG45321.1 TonB-dependent receptor [Rhodothermaceae bacterium]